MPAGPNTTQSLQPTYFPVQGSLQLLGNLATNSSICGQTAGSLCVYPGTGMVVEVDTGFTLFESGTGVLFQNGGSPVAVTLTAPGSNSYYATIYWDQTANTCGVVYGTSGVSPTPILPNFLTQIPLAVVLIPTGTSTITAAMITDIRKWWQFGHLDHSNASFGAGGDSLNCACATDIWLFEQITAAAGTLTLINLRWGTRINMIWFNNTAAAKTVFLVASTPSGTTLPTTITPRAGTSAPVPWNSTSSNSFAGSGKYTVLSLYYYGTTDLVFS